VFLEISKANHSCRPNAQLIWNGEIGKATLHASHDISEGEAITITYLPESKVGEITEPEHVVPIWKFNCNCDFHIQSLVEHRVASNEYRRKIGLLFKKLAKTDDAALCLYIGKSLLEGLSSEFINDWRLGAAYFELFRLMARNKGMKRAKQFAVLAYVAYELCEGEDSASISKLQKEANKLAEMSGDGGEKVALSRLAKSMGNEHGGEQWAAQDVNVLTMDEDVFDLLFMKSNWLGDVARKE
jgi:hypothetical protein